MPRTSFALWQESVKLKSRPWLDLEIDAAREFRVAILELILKQAEKIGDLYKSLERSYIELDSFAYVASHDLKEPLRGIHNYSRFLLEDCVDQLRPEDIEKLRAMSRLTQRMEDLLDSLLSYSRISRNDMRRQDHDLNQIVANALDSLSALVADSKADIRIPRPLPSISLDAVSVGEVFSNLISNALKYNDKQEKWVEIGYLDQSQAPIVFFVRDNGIGIDAEHFESIFKIFRRLHGPKEFGGGTGAGLTIVHKIIQRHHGRIWVESSPGSGSTFYFTLAPAPREGGRNVSQVPDISG
jgi:light-regulated signal transduction histidine kinase (bacteriophytochrome)